MALEQIPTSRWPIGLCKDLAAFSGDINEIARLLSARLTRDFDDLDYFSAFIVTEGGIDIAYQQYEHDPKRLILIIGKEGPVEVLHHQLHTALEIAGIEISQLSNIAPELALAVQEGPEFDAPRQWPTPA